MKLCESDYFKSKNLTQKKISLIWGGNREIKLEDLLPENRAAQIAAKMGMWILDSCDLEALSVAAKKRRRWEFLLTASPLAVTGATGSPANPIATF